MKKILIIKLGALGDFVQATGAFSAIRQHHQGAEITLLTTKGMMPFAKNNPNFDRILIDDRGKLYNWSYLKQLRENLKGYDMVYDLQTNDRTNYAYFFLAGMPNWCGIAPFCKLKQTNPNRKNMHTLDRLADQLAVAGIKPMGNPNLEYMAEDVSSLLEEHQLDPSRTVLLIAGGSAHRPEKRWPHFAKLSEMLEVKGYKPVLIGAGAEAALLNDIATKCRALNLCNQTSLGQIVGLSSKVAFVVGNDTGPTHIAAASGAKGVVLFGHASDPKRCAPRAEGFHIIQKADMADIAPQEIIDILEV